MQEYEWALVIYYSVEKLFLYSIFFIVFLQLFKNVKNMISSLVEQKQASGDIWPAGKSLHTYTNTHTH